MTLTVVDAGKPVAFTYSGISILEQDQGAITWESTGTATDWELHIRAKLECDGYINYQLTVKSLKCGQADDIVLELPFARDVAKYMMGLNRLGGYRPDRRLLPCQR